MRKLFLCTNNCPKNIFLSKRIDNNVGGMIDVIYDTIQSMITGVEFRGCARHVGPHLEEAKDFVVLGYRVMSRNSLSSSVIMFSERMDKFF